MSGLSNPGSGLDYQETLSAAHNAVAAGWRDWDISALIVSGTKAVDVLMIVPAGAPVVGVREDGSAVVRQLGQVTSSLIATVRVLSSGVIEIWDDTGTTNFYIIGCYV